MTQNGEKSYKHLPTSSSASSLSALGASVENSLHSKLTFFLILASFFLFLLLHQSFISMATSSSSSSFSNLLLLYSSSRSANHVASPTPHSNRTASFNNTTTYADKTAKSATDNPTPSKTADDDHPAEVQIRESSYFVTTTDSNITTYNLNITNTQPNRTADFVISTTDSNVTTYLNTTNTQPNRTADDLHPAEKHITEPSDVNITADSNITAYTNTRSNKTTDDLHPAGVQIKPSDLSKTSNSTLVPTNKTHDLSSSSANTTLVPTNKTSDFNTSTTRAPPPSKPAIDEEEVRTFHPYGSAAALFVLYSAYRGGNDTFAVIGLGSKPLYVYGKPKFECYWHPSASHTNQSKIKSKLAYTMEPDFGFGRVYTVVVLNCTFGEPVGTAADQRGGQLVLHAFYGDGLGKTPERIVALEEDEHSYNASAFQPPYPYEYLYCGSPLFSNLNAQRMREWMAYHVMKFGPRSHFIFHDAGGMHAGVRAVLEPWKKQGFVTIQNVKQTTQYDGYYYNQFLIVNDCLHRTKFMADWTFFFDVDEYIYNPPDVSLRFLLDWHSNHTSVSFQQLRMSDSLCQFPEPENDTRWAFEKLVYGQEHRDQKYAVQARGIYATGVHYSQKELGHMDGERGWAWWPHMRFYHYHDSISRHGKVCKKSTRNATSYTYHKQKFKRDTSMVSLGPLVQAFERAQIGTP